MEKAIRLVSIERGHDPRDFTLVAFGGAGVESSVFASLILGFLAAAISFARYFPNREEDLAKVLVAKVA